MQPRAEAPIKLECLGPACEDEEDRLESVVRLVAIGENAPAGSVHEWAMSVDESRKRVFVPLALESA